MFYDICLFHSCTMPREPCASAPCKNGGSCVAGGVIRHKCICPPGFTGGDCAVDIGQYTVYYTVSSEKANGIQREVSIFCPKIYIFKFFKK